MFTMKKTVFAAALALTGVLTTQQAFAAIALDRTRVVYNGGEKSISLSISNENKICLILHKPGLRMRRVTRLHRH